MTLNVTPVDYFWSGYVKHTNARWETDTIPLEDIDSEAAHGWLS
jgi:hypothetical protein